MKIESPMEITPRLLPGVRIGDGWVSWDHSLLVGYVDAPGLEHVDESMLPGFSGRTGPEEAQVRAMLGAFLGFLGACAESRAYGTRQHGDPMKGENSDLFPEDVGVWAEAHSDEIGIASMELEGGGK